MSHESLFESVFESSHIDVDAVNEQKLLKVDARSRVINTAEHPFNCSGKIVAHVKVTIDGCQQVLTAIGTGTILENNLVITSAHVLNFKKYNKIATDVFFYPAWQKTDLKGKLYQGIKVKSFHIDPKYYQSSDVMSSRYYSALLVLEQNNLITQDQCISIKWDYQLYDFKAVTIMVAGYSDDRQDIQDFQNQNNNRLYFEQRVADEQRDTFLMYSHTTTEGNSGGPVLIRQNDGDYKLIGVHKGCSGTKNYCLLLTQIQNTHQIFKKMLKNTKLQTKLFTSSCFNCQQLLKMNLLLKQQANKKNQLINELKVTIDIKQKQIKSLNEVIERLQKRLNEMNHQKSEKKLQFSPSGKEQKKQVQKQEIAKNQIIINQNEIISKVQESKNLNPKIQPQQIEKSEDWKVNKNKNRLLKF